MRDGVGVGGVVGLNDCVAGATNRLTKQTANSLPRPPPLLFLFPHLHRRDGRRVAHRAIVPHTHLHTPLAHALAHGHRGTPILVILVILGVVAVPLEQFALNRYMDMGEYAMGITWAWRMRMRMRDGG